MLHGLMLFLAEPRTVKDILLDLKEDFTSDIIYKDVTMTMNFMKLCKLFYWYVDDTKHVIAGTWNYGEDYIRGAVQVNARKFHSLKPQVILLAGFQDSKSTWFQLIVSTLELKNLG